MKGKTIEVIDGCYVGNCDKQLKEDLKKYIGRTGTNIRDLLTEQELFTDKLGRSIGQIKTADGIDEKYLTNPTDPKLNTAEIDFGDLKLLFNKEKNLRGLKGLKNPR